MGNQRWWGVAVVTGCALSLAGVGAVRSAEEWFGPALSVLDGPLTSLLPAHADGEWVAALRTPAAQAFHVHAQTVLGSVKAACPGRSTLLVPVEARDPERHELRIAAPALGASVGAAVSHGGVLLGFVSALSADTRHATVALLGQPSLRPIAAQWCATQGGRAVDVLVTGQSGAGGFVMCLGDASSRVPPLAGQLVRTRDVAALGDSLPAGLLLGRVAPTALELPGGGLAADLGADATLELLVDPFALALVALEVAPGGALTARAQSARLFGTTRSSHGLRLAAGARDGLQRGDWVVQDGLFVGVVEVVAPFSSLVDTTVPAGSLLVMSPTGEVVSCEAARESWPAGWEPARGDLLACGHALTGGLVVGRVGDLAEDGLRIARHAPDVRRPVTVIGP